MTQNKKILQECVKVRNVNSHFAREVYIRDLFTTDEQVNYKIFYKFACTCSSTLLSMFFNCGYFQRDRITQNIASKIIITRRLFGKDEQDYNEIIERPLDVP